MLNRSPMLLLSALLLSTAAGAAPVDQTSFLAYPMATDISAAEAPTFAWLVRQGQTSKLMVAAAPDFTPRQLFARDDVDGDPITRVVIAPDGSRVAFQTGSAVAGDDGYNPASLLEPPKATLWLIDAKPGARPLRLGNGVAPRFAPDGKRVLWRRGS